MPASLNSSALSDIWKRRASPGADPQKSKNVTTNMIASIIHDVCVINGACLESSTISFVVAFGIPQPTHLLHPKQDREDNSIAAVIFGPKTSC